MIPQIIHAPSLLLLGLALLVWHPFSVPAQEAGAAGPLETRYRKSLQGLEQTHKANRSKTLRAYTAALGKLNDSLKRKSDLDGILGIRKELERLKQENNLQQQDINPKQTALAGLQRKVINRLNKENREYAERIVGSTLSYIQALEKTQKKLVKTDRIDEAIQIKARIVQVQEEEPYRSARALLDNKKKAREAARTAAQEMKAKQQATQRALPQHDEPNQPKDDPNSNRAVIYPPGTPPPVLRGARRENLHHTGAASKAIATRMNAIINVLSKSDDQKVNPSGGDYYKWVGKRVTPRVSLSSGPKPISSSQLVIEYFGKGSGSQRNMVHAEKINLPPMENNRTVTIDAAGHTFNSDYLHVHANGHKHSVPPPSQDEKKLSGEYGGFIISVFEDNGSLVFQRCSQPALSKYAKDQP